MEKKSKKARIRVENYGDMFAKVLQMDLIVYREYGSYSGSWIAVLKDEDRIFFYKDYYGSCSGCDWLEAEKDYETDEVDAKSAIQFVGDVKASYIFPISIAKSLSEKQIRDMLEQGDLSYDEEGDEVIGGIIKQLSKLKQ